MPSKTFFNDKEPTEKLLVGKLPALNEELTDDEGLDNGVLTAVSSAVKFRKLRKNHLKRNPGLKHFERRYTELGPLLKPEQRRVDYILIYDKKTSRDEVDPEKRKSLEDKEAKRERFKSALKLEGFLIQEATIRNNVFVKLHCPFKRMCAEAEMVKLEMPLKGCDKAEPKPGCFGKFLEENFETDNEVDFVSAPFVMDRIQLYEGYEDPTNFFRSSVRTMLVHHILINLDIRNKDDKERKVLQIREKKDSSNSSSYFPFNLLCCKREELKEEDIEFDKQLTTLENATESETNRRASTSSYDSNAEDDEADLVLKNHEPMSFADDSLAKRGLPYLLMKNVYTDAFPLHEESNKSKYNEETIEMFFEEEKEEDILEMDPRKDLDETWTKFLKFQPLWKIRNYFGEKIALYFAWSGMLTSSLWIPTVFGIGIFLYGLINSQITDSEPLKIPSNFTAIQDLMVLSLSPLGGVGKQLMAGKSSESINMALSENSIKLRMENLLDDVRKAFDNSVTPYFALIICLWGTVFLELWKRTNATLAYEWDVDNFEVNEPDRPQFFGLKVKKDPITSEENWVYPFKRLILKYTGSTLVVIFMILVVFACVVGVIVYRVIMGVDYCPGMSAVECLMITTVLSSVLNGVSILLLGMVYDKLAVILTDWENHRTQSRYDDALIIKIFAFQFANTYASCFYIAFFRGRYDVFGVFDLGKDYRDECSKTCMSQLSFQVMVLMLIKPFPKFLKDIILPTLRKLWRNRPNWCCRCRCCYFCQCCRNKITDAESPKDKDQANEKINFDYIENERLKPDLGEFTLGEYTEKILQYGFLMLFAASFPLAPLLALLTNVIDVRVDAKRMLWMYRRPVAQIRGDIGKWYGILQFVNLIGVVTNGFIIAFTSSWAEGYSTTEKLWLVIGFEHLVFGLKFLLAYLIPDVPSVVALDIRREKFQVAKLLGSSTLSKVGSHDIIDYSELVPKYSKKRRQRSSNYDTFDDPVETYLENIAEKSGEKSEEKSSSDPKPLLPSLPNKELMYTKPSYKVSDSLNESFNTAISISGIQPSTPKNKDTEA